ncbi:MAG TPA: glycosyltransferase family 2 protein [Rubrivivax sp.]|nr:glycosyltransferase family 2 protein [Rubrivivax sp.]
MTPQVQLLKPLARSAPSTPTAPTGVVPAATAGSAVGSVVEDYLDRLSVVVPVRNEADNVLPLIEEIHAVLDGLADFELIYVDDGSTDATAQRLALAQAAFPRLRVVRHPRGYGQSTAIASGVRAARHPWIATLDGDRQNHPADLPRLLDALRPGRRAPDLAMVIGWRTARHDNAVRRLSSRITNGVRARLLGDATPDTGCGLKVFPRELFLRLPFFDHLHRFLPALVQREGGQVVSVPVSHRARPAGTSKYGIHNRLWVGIVDLFGVMWLQRRATRPAIEP